MKNIRKFLPNYSLHMDIIVINILITWFLSISTHTTDVDVFFN